MKTRVQKWGNSLALRIPKSFATEISLAQGSEVKVSLVGKKIVVSPLQRSKYILRHLVSKITEKNRHREIDTGHPAGNETW